MDPLLFRVILGYFSDPLVDDELGGGSPMRVCVLAEDFVEELCVPFCHSLHESMKRGRWSCADAPITNGDGAVGRLLAYHANPPFCFSCVASTSSGDSPGRNGQLGSCSRGPGVVGAGFDFLFFLSPLTLAGTLITVPSPPVRLMSCATGNARCRQWRDGFSTPLAVRR